MSHNDQIVDAAGSVGLLGYQIEPSRENEQYNTDYFFNQMDGSLPSKEITN